jgi:hypothetical protein
VAVFVLWLGQQRGLDVFRRSEGFQCLGQPFIAGLGWL